jgi:hypothetical protein
MVCAGQSSSWLRKSPKTTEPFIQDARYDARPSADFMAHQGELTGAKSSKSF